MKDMPQFVKDEVASCLRDLADAHLQEDTWVKAKPGGPGSPSELVSQLFDDTALTDYLGGATASPIFSPAADALLLQISEQLDELNLEVSPRVLLRNPQWVEIQRKAAQALSLIEQLGGSS